MNQQIVPKNRQPTLIHNIFLIKPQSLERKMNLALIIAAIIFVGVTLVLNVLYYVYEPNTIPTPNDNSKIKKESDKEPESPDALYVKHLDPASFSDGVSVTVQRTEGLIQVQKSFKDVQVERYYVIPNGATLHTILY